MDVIKSLIEQTDFKYIRVLACFYMRLVGSTIDIYKTLESVLEDYRKIVVRNAGLTGPSQWSETTIDQFVWDLMHNHTGYILSVQLPRLPPRSAFENSTVMRKVTDKKRPSKLRGDPRVKDRISKRKRELKESSAASSAVPSEASKKPYNGLFKTSKREKKNGKSAQDDDKGKQEGKTEAEEGSVEFWNNQRTLLGLKPLKE